MSGLHDSAEGGGSDVKGINSLAYNLIYNKQGAVGGGITGLYFEFVFLKIRYTYFYIYSQCSYP
jgi:hypothetical protein